MRVVDLRRKLDKEKDNVDVVVILNKKDIDRINLLAKNETNYIVLNIIIGEKLVEKELPLFVTGGIVPYDQIKKFTKEEIDKLEIGNEKSVISKVIKHLEILRNAQKHTTGLPNDELDNLIIYLKTNMEIQPK